MTTTLDAAARVPRGGGGRGAAGSGVATGGARSFGPAGGFNPAGAGGAAAYGGRPSGGPFVPGQPAGSQSLPATTQQAINRGANPAANAAQVQQWLGVQAAANPAAAARQGQYAQAAAAQHQNGPAPFSPAWYAQHPNAWQATHPHADAAAVATAAGVTAWIAGTAYATPTESTSGATVVYANVEQAPADIPTPATEGEWLLLGTFTIKPHPGASATHVVQLSTNRSAQLGGVQYDLASGATQNVTGTIDARTSAVKWSLDATPGVRYLTSLGDLTSGLGVVSMSLPNTRQTQTLRIERQASP